MKSAILSLTASEKSAFQADSQGLQINSKLFNSATHVWDLSFVRWGIGTTEFNHVPLLNMLVVMNAESPACYGISGIPALPIATSGFFGCSTENSALLSEFKIPDDPIFHVCSLHQQWKRLHVTLIVVLWVPFLCRYFGVLCILFMVSLRGIGYYYNANNKNMPQTQVHMLLSFSTYSHTDRSTQVSQRQMHQ